MNGLMYHGTKTKVGSEVSGLFVKDEKKTNTTSVSVLDSPQPVSKPS